MKPANIQVIGTELALAWEDGAESYFPLEWLRRRCPCATCQGEPDVLGKIIRTAEPSYSEKSFRVRQLQVVGGYALQPTWDDGHGSGLYSWQYLRRLQPFVPTGG
jgi:DUF971 family protein